MALHPILNEKLSAAVDSAGAVTPPSTRRDAQLAAVPGKVHAVIGMRRAGKTTFLRQLQGADRQSMAPSQTVYLSFDDDRLAGVDATQLDALLEEHYRRYPALRTREPVHWYFDEVQLVPGWERFVRRVIDTEQVRIVVSGSSARLLSREVHTSLRGRGIATIIRPFSFREYLRHRGEEPSAEPVRWTPADRSLLERRFHDYLIEGGFPETQGLAPRLRIELLQGYVDTVLFRDVIERYDVSQTASLRWIVRHALRNPAGTFSVNRLHQDLKAQGHAIGVPTVHELLGHLVDAFLLGEVHLATDSERRRNSNPKKLYPADSGLIRAFEVSGRTNIGHALETAVFVELDRRGGDIGYVKTADGYEVDFLVRDPAHEPDPRHELIQVCADASDPSTLEREMRALQAASREFSSARRLLLVLDRSGMPTNASLGGSEVAVRPAYEWMLERLD